MTIEIVRFPIKNGDIFHSSLYVYQRKNNVKSLVVDLLPVGFPVGQIAGSFSFFLHVFCLFRVAQVEDQFRDIRRHWFFEGPWWGNY